VSVEARSRRIAPPDHLDIAVVAYPQLSNFDDFLPLERERGVTVRFVRDPREAGSADLLILPGAKQTLPALRWLRQQAWDCEIARRLEAGRPVLGICGGCQMLSERIEDPEGRESELRSGRGLGYLPLAFTMNGEKRTTRVRARVLNFGLLTADTMLHDECEGYEIHLGKAQDEIPADPACASVQPAFRVTSRNGEGLSEPDGAVTREGLVIGTMIHGLFANPGLRRGLLASLTRRAGRPVLWTAALADGDQGGMDPYDRLADVLEEHLDREALNRLLPDSMMKIRG
jgi:adenosylcobyric acid synthase